MSATGYKDTYNIRRDSGFTGAGHGFLYCICLSIAICLLVSVFLIFPLIERITNAKQVQIMTGVHPGIFWFANLTWDIGLLILSSLLAIIILIGMDAGSYFTTHGAGGRLEFF